jgi:hypothetical protein
VHELGERLWVALVGLGDGCAEIAETTMTPEWVG